MDDQTPPTTPTKIKKKYSAPAIGAALAWLITWQYNTHFPAAPIPAEGAAPLGVLLMALVSAIIPDDREE